MFPLLSQQFPATDFALLGLVLALPLVSALVNGIFGKRLGKDAVRTMSLVTMGAAFLVSVVAFLMLSGMHGGEGAPAAKLTWNVYNWFTIDGIIGRRIPIDITFSLDALSATMMLVVTGVGFLIHLYSTAYMAKDDGFYRFFAYLNLFVFSMLVLILGDNLAVLFVGWEGVGLCSYLLIGFWFDDEKKAAAGKKAFITNRIGDFGLLLAMAMLIYHVGTLQFGALESAAGSLVKPLTVWPVTNLANSALPTVVADALMPAVPYQVYASTLVALLLFVGCVGKSAQMPLYVWLPDAMAGPTPVSALIHAATMVTAGVYLVARTSFIFALSPAAMAIVAATGAFTALFAASIAFAQTDLKKVLAYSTVSQLGFMFIGVGMGAFAAGFFHVITHAFFKGCLFLCAGSVIHAMHKRIHDDDASQDMRNMGGLRRYMPITHATFLVSCLAIAGCPPLSGFWSKDELLFKAFQNQIVTDRAGMWTPPAWFGQAIYAVGIVAAVCTAFYMFRAYFMTFWGNFRGWSVVTDWHHGHDHDHDHDHDEPLLGPRPNESPAAMTIPLVVLACFAAVLGLVYAEPLHSAPLEHFWAPVFATGSRTVVARAGSEAMMLPLLGVGISVFAIGAGAAYYVYVVNNGAPAAAFVRRVPRLHRLVLNKWKVDEFYEATFLGLIDAMGDTAAQFDRWIIDGIVARLTAAITRVSGLALRALHTGRVQVYAASMVIGTALIGWFLFRPHAEAKRDLSALRSGGEVNFVAAPGHGYRYRWREGADTPAAEGDSGFGDDASYTLSLSNCETRTVHLEVKNAFGSIAQNSYTECREVFPGCCKPEGQGGILPRGIKAPIAPGAITASPQDAGVLQKLIPTLRVPKTPTPAGKQGGGR